MRIALRCASGYLTAELGGEAQPARGLVTANRPTIGAWEIWTVELHPEGFAFKSANGFYLCAEGGGGSLLCANRSAAGAWEMFTVVPQLVDQQVVTIRTSNGNSLSVPKLGDHVVDAASVPTSFTVEVVEADSRPTRRGELSRLSRIDGHRMINEHGEKVFGRGASAFLLYKKYLDGDDVQPQLQQLQGLGCNLIRVMGMFESLGGFNPKAYGDRYYAQIVPFCTLCEAFGIYVLWTACAATGAWMTADEALQHTKRTAGELLATNAAIFSYVNEQGQHNNSVDRARFFSSVPKGWMLFDTGSFGEDQPCEPPFGTHVTLHVNRRYPNSVKDSCILDHPNHVNDHLEVGLDEPARYGNTDDPNGNASVEQAADAAGTAYTALFWVFHSLQGEKGEVLRGNTLDCAQAAFAAMKGH
jgi:hypothetical protein